MATPAGNDAGFGSKSNDYAIDALKQVLTLAGAILALTITFLRDTLGEARADATFTCLVPLAWLLLTFVIWMAWVAIAEAAKTLGTGQVTGYAFAKGTTARMLARAAQVAFVGALAALALFATVNLPLYFRVNSEVGDEPQEAQPVSPSTVDSLRHIGAVGPFRPARHDELQEGAVDIVAMRIMIDKEANGRDVTFVILVGSSDIGALRGSSRYGSNAGLARGRAEWVHEELRSAFGSASPEFIVLTSGPRYHGRRAEAMDRVVHVYVNYRSASVTRRP